MLLIQVLWLLLGLSWIYWLIALWLVHDFFDSEDLPDGEFNPPVSILKPVKGVDPGAFENFVSFCSQDYPEYELVFGVDDPRDPVVPILERLKRKFPAQSIQLVRTPRLGPNRKANILHHLVAHARHDVLAISDSDMRVTPDYLQRVVQPLADGEIGLVTSLYRGAEPTTFGGLMEALHTNFTFLPNVLAGRKVLSMRFALGASMVLRRIDLEAAGGFAPLREHLADDYTLGLRITQSGKRVYLSRHVMINILGAMRLRDQWNRDIRWSVTGRAVEPYGILGLIITFSTPLALLLFAASDYSTTSLLALTLSLTLRWTVARPIAGYIGDDNPSRWQVWLPLRDVLSSVVWAVALVSRQVVWRGQKFVVRSDGTMRPAPASEAEVPVSSQITGRDS